MNARLFALITLGALITGCGEASPPTESIDLEATSYYALTSASPGVYLSPPLAPSPSFEGRFLPGIADQLRTVVLETSTEGDSTRVAELSMAELTQFETYFVDVPVARYFTDRARNYRVQVERNGRVIAFSDVSAELWRVLDSVPELRMGVKLRIEQGWALTPDPNRCPNGSMVSSGDDFSCVLDAHGAIRCVGAGAQDVPEGHYVSLGGTCAIRDDFTVACWNGLESPSGHYRAVSSTGAGWAAWGCGLDLRGGRSCWGLSHQEHPSANLGEHAGISVDFGHGCAVDVEGHIACFGQEDYGDNTPPSTPVTQVTVGVIHGCGLGRDGLAHCWGHRGVTLDPPTTPFVSLSAGDYSTCGLTSSGSLECWGNYYAIRNQAPAGNFCSVSPGWVHTCALGVDGALTCWGLTEITSAPSGTSRARSGTVQLRPFPFADAPDTRFECSLDGGPFTTCVSPVALTNLQVGHHRFEARAVMRGLVEAIPAAAEWDVAP